MNGSSPRGTGRYAPSPTGDLHLGNLRTALIAWLFARSTGRAFVPRIVDLDTAHVRLGSSSRQWADLAALGITFDGAPRVQSRCAPAYADALDQLAGLTYECFCTRREIAEAASAPRAEDTRYPGTCRDLDPAERARRRRTRPPALRIRADGATHRIVDLQHGSVTRPVDDIVVRRPDGAAAYQLAVVVDDAAQEVDQVVRGDDLLTSAVHQAWLAERLGLAVPTYAHVPLAVDRTGARLSKRDRAVTLRDLAATGVGPDDVRSRLIASLGAACPSPDDPAAGFDPHRLPRVPWVVG